ncbi:MAG TPA: hypothetical protein VGR02_09810 [Thermoanaerobaculia bacterium]|jgi:hypothetical protein|nr:hypothetical protein [Thermoanaerobaculia bacterium]
MLFIVAALTLKLDLGALLNRAPMPQVVAKNGPRVECNIKTVSYRFQGEPGAEFRYDGETFKVPAGGEIELLASKRATDYLVGGKTLPLDVFPADEFGARTIPMPKAR